MVETLDPAGPFSIRLPFERERAQLPVAGGEAEVSIEDGWITVEVARVTDHEVVVPS
jgi:hypothetical protein